MKKLGFRSFLKYFTFYNLFIIITVGLVATTLILIFSFDRALELGTIEFVPEGPLKTGVFYSVKDFFGKYIFSLREEFMYRCIILMFLLRKSKNKWFAVLLSSLFFLLAHGKINADIFFGGVFLSLVYLKERSLFLVSFLHIAMNIETTLLKMLIVYL
jgi:membrane protease YdiL (CAAX protease family)